MLAGALLLGACVTKKYTGPEMNTARLYRDTTITDTSTLANLPVNRLFTDTVLQNLIKEGLQQNLDLKTAIERIKEADATLRQSKAAYLPTLSAEGNFTRAKQSAAGLNFPADLVNSFPLASNTYQLDLTASWEVDIWGKLSSSKRAAFATLLQSEASKRAVQTKLIADIANDYYSLLAYDQQLAITQQTVKNRINDYETMKALKESAVVNGAAVVQSEANRYAAEVTIPDLKRSIRETENALSVLLARTPGQINRAKLADQQPYEQLLTGVPSQLLKNRPDIQEAEYAFRIAFENVNLAKSYFYPSLTFNAEGGVSALQVKNLFKNSLFYNVVGGLTQPILNKGENKARLRTNQAKQQEAFYSYQQTFLTAGQEVSNALFAYETSREKQVSRTKQLAALEKSVDFTKELLRYSSATNYTDVLTSEQSLLSAQLSGVNDKLQQLQAIVNLYQALGGGWK